MNYREEARRIAHVLRERLSTEELAMLLDLMGDHTTDEWLYKAIMDPSKGPQEKPPPEAPPSRWERLRSP